MKAAFREVKMNKTDAEKWTTEYLKPVFGFALKTCRSIEDAEDLSQEIMAKVYVALIKRDDIADVSKFIWTIAHINFENGMITINHTVVKFSTIVQKDCTKSDASYRAFPMMQEIKDILVELKQQEETNRKLFGKEYIENDYIFKKVNGEPYRPDYVTKKFGKLLKKNGLRKIRLHDLRHSCASLLATNGYNMKDIQEWLGHKDIQTTANIYSHLDISRKIQIAGATVGFVPGKNAGKSLDAPLDD